jgi:hypothetical protein
MKGQNMKVLVIGKATKDSEAGVMAPEEKWEEMGQFNEELIKAGILVAAYGLHPSSKGVRVHISGKDHIVTDGPFAETKELIAGFMIWEVKSMEEAIAWVKRSPNCGTGDADVEIRPIFSPEDIGEAVSPEIQQEVEGRWAKVASRDKQ